MIGSGSTQYGNRGPGVKQHQSVNHKTNSISHVTTGINTPDTGPINLPPNSIHISLLETALPLLVWQCVKLQRLCVYTPKTSNMIHSPGNFLPSPAASPLHPRLPRRLHEVEKLSTVFLRALNVVRHLLLMPKWRGGGTQAGLLTGRKPSTDMLIILFRRTFTRNATLVYLICLFAYYPQKICTYPIQSVHRNTLIFSQWLLKP